MTSRQYDWRTKVLAGVIAAMLLAGGTLAHWRAKRDEVSLTRNIPPNPVKNISTASTRDLADIPPEAFQPQPPTAAGYNAYSGGLPPGALPPGVTLPGMPMMQGGRTAAQGYGVYDGIRQQFTGKERDAETGLDYFGARYYSSAQGRFTSPDEVQSNSAEFALLGKGDPIKQALPSADLTNPQSLNKYQYAYNNPLRYIDPDGQNPQDSLELNLRRDEKALAEGRITPEQFRERQNARGIGAAVGAAIVALAIAGPEAATAILMWAARNPDKVEQIAVATQEAAGGPPGAITGAVGSSSKAELSIAQRLVGEGKNVEILAPTGVGRTADFIINGVKTELKTLQGVGGVATSGTVKSAIGRALGQSGNVIIDASGVKLTAAEAEKGVARAFGADSRLQAVRVIGKDFDFIRVRNQ